MGKKVSVSMEDRKKSYFKYYMQDIYVGEADRYDEIGELPFDNSKALLLKDRNDLFKDGDLPGEFGWWLLDDGSATIANETFFPGATGEMFDWWFAWHPIDRLRYACWDSEDHYDVRLEDYEKALNPNLTLREKHWDSVHYIWEDIGMGVDLLKIKFKKPAELGYDESKIDTDACSTIICANCTTFGSGEIPDMPVVMTHFVRPVEGGVVLRSRFWFGWQIINGQAVKCIPDVVKVPPIVPKTLLKHNIKEFSNLSKILPSIYAEEKDNWNN